ncbi:molybdopterin molybdotransferase [Bosea sp. OAE752]|uniref:molybdopterin molybdotransferase MoeA n=1 Tax=unclassified Bosea (in: a-proteobacteria) TaxID=2653178 RepID=UPI0035236F04
MARLKGIGPGHAPMTLAEAGARAVSLVAPVAGTQALPLSQADGRVLARDVFAGLPLPPFANSAVDGYALRFDDLAPDAETRLPVLGRVAAGETAPSEFGRGALRIFTGAPIPPGADTVVMQEDVRREGDAVLLPPGLRRGANLRPAGEDVARGARAFAAGHRLRPQDLGLLAALGLERVTLRRRPRVALFSTGDELTEPGGTLPPAAIYDANRPMLRALLARAGAEPVDLGILRDDRDGLAARLKEAARDCDLVITSGGVSVGEEDHVRAALATLGSLDFWQIAIKPGKPVAVGTIAETPFLGLPGNPVAVFVTFAFVARPMIARLAGTACDPLLRLPVRLGFSHRGKPGRREFLRVSVEPGADAVPLARRHPGEGAGSLASLTQSDGLVELAEDPALAEEGSIQPFLPYSALLG